MATMIGPREDEPCSKCGGDVDMWATPVPGGGFDREIREGRHADGRMGGVDDRCRREPG